MSGGSLRQESASSFPLGAPLPGEGFAIPELARENGPVTSEHMAPPPGLALHYETIALSESCFQNNRLPS